LPCHNQPPAEKNMLDGKHMSETYCHCS